MQNIYQYIESFLWKKFTSSKDKNIGIELEFPLIDETKKYGNIEIHRKLIEYFIRENNFIQIENQLQCYCPINYDEISFDFSANIVEFSMAKSRNILEIKKRFENYYSLVSEFLKPYKFKLGDTGIHPDIDLINFKSLDSPYYRMVQAHLSSGKTNSLENSFCSYSCSIHTHVDVSLNEMEEYIELLSFISSIKVVLFSNSLLNTNLHNDNNCVRDYLWRNSRFGYYPWNVNHYKPRCTLEEIIHGITKREVFYVCRNNEYVRICPRTLDSFYSTRSIKGKNVTTNEDVIIQPEYRDFEMCRSYKPVEVRNQGTLEVRDDCQQPLTRCFAPSAFIKGCLNNIDESKQIKGVFIKKYPAIFSNYEKSRLLLSSHNFIKNHLDSTFNSLVKELLRISFIGLKREGLGEEILIEHLLYDDIISPAEEFRRNNDINNQRKSESI